ncbi:uncharacterized protein [Spinacia oleracea]|uniref:Peptidase S9 prolyl oligopeptidase catalytic domain-containing protein n=1 Tax=Spinacia oleracea TaxID=3562 RepID=A0ABM3RVT7_SPIOL|nr:uncharacterized protein LOC130472495 [Spinacia oleracea]
MRSTLERFGSNIVFSNGLMDPFSPFGVLKYISKTFVALTTKKGSHCLDFNYPSHDDPKWLKLQREKELKMFSRWINNNSFNSPQILFNWFCFGLVFTLLL